MDSDDDYIYIGEIISENKEEFVHNTQKENMGQGRGGDIDCIEVAQIEGVEDFKKSDFYSDIQQHFTMRKGRENNYADTETYYCNFTQKKMYKICL